MSVLRINFSNWNRVTLGSGEFQVHIDVEGGGGEQAGNKTSEVSFVLYDIFVLYLALIN